MIAPLSKRGSVQRWLARHEVLEQFVWVDRVHDASEWGDEAPFERRTPHPGAAEVIDIERVQSPSGQPFVTMTSTFVPSISLEHALESAAHVWPTATRALATLRGAIAPMSHVLEQTKAALDPSSLAVDADGRIFVAQTTNATPRGDPPQALAAATIRTAISAIASAFSEDEAVVSFARAVDAVAELEFERIDALFEQQLGADFGERSPDAASTDEAALRRQAPEFNAVPDSLERGPLAPVRLARMAMRGAPIDHLPAAKAITTTLVDELRARRPLCANRLVLLGTVPQARTVLRDLTIRDSSIDPRALALLGPLEPTWIPLHPEVTAKTIRVGDAEVTLCPMQWDELQPTASRDGGDRRFCLACAKAVRSVLSDGETRVVASNMCSFVRRAGQWGGE